MAGVWKRDGTVAVTNGSKKVTGTGTTFADTKNGVAKGHLFCITSGTSVDFYEVDYVVSNTELYLVQAYRGTTAAGKAYEIITTFSDSVPEFARRLTATLSAYQQQSDAFQALLTSTATTVEVTAPDGTKQTLIPWKRVTSEGEGQAARAKTEADKAAASAALAGDIVAVSALPLPDVWAPLSDSLRLITGYGRDVLVGSDVVARMVNLSRNSTATYIGKDGQLKTAAANEPRFEKEGLLIEGQSTNLFNKAAGTNFSWISSVLSQSAGSAQLPFDVFQKAITSSNAAQGASERVLTDIYGISNPAAQAGGPVTVSALMFGDADAIVSASPELKILVDLSITGISRSVIKINSTTVRVIWSGVIAPGSSATFVAFQLNWLNRLPSVVAGCYQVEALPFASSYIPTNGAAVTRAADVCWIPVENGGLPGMDNEKTMSLTSNILGVNGPFNFILATPWGAIDYTLTHERVSGNTPELAMNTPVALKTSVRKVARFTKGGGCAAIFGDIQKTGPTADWSLSTSRIVIGSMNESGANPHFGHVKDLKIWLKPLSDAQMKAIA
ncbi:phage head spike fiber domain-containing protein [Aeromonas caviae]|uniref:phage head spike fiber domain-containing protein n=1 Tax=Aeromonas caviae TaxID=648 RepID=UPI002F3F8A54